MWQKVIKNSAIYRTNDKIENLQIQITLKTISSLLKIEKFDLKTPRQKDSNEHQQQPTTTENDESEINDDHIEVITIKWQEKILSHYEIEFYKDIENCLTDVQKNYHNLINRDELIENDLRNIIFTYVDNDNFVPKEELMLYNKPIITKNSITSSPIPITFQYRKNNLLTNSEVMYIYADLNPDTLLLSLNWLPTENILIVYPDFNEFNRSPYFIEIDTDYRHLYSYAVKNVSITKSILFDTTTANNWLPIQEIPSSLSLLQKQQTSLFNMPEKKSIRFILIFNIQQAENFEYDSLHVRYKFELPQNIRIESPSLNDEKFDNCESLLIGSTHSSIGTYQDEKKIWNFGHSIQLILTTNDENLKFHQQNVKIYFEIISIDSWERERIEGYSYISIILKPGKENYQLICYRPNFGLIDRIGRYFIGGRIPFDVKNFNNINSNGFLNRYQNHTITTGLLKFDIECIVQRKLELLSKDLCETKSLKKKSSSAMTLNDIMRSYQEARKRLEATFEINSTEV